MEYKKFYSLDQVLDNFGGYDFGYAGNLNGASLNCLDLSGINFSGMSLVATDLRYSILDGCRFDKADLTGAGLQYCSAKQASFVSACCLGSRFTRADLTGATFDKADLSLAIFRKANLESASFIKANLERANLEKVNANGVSFEGANISETVMTGMSIRNITFQFGFRHVESIVLGNRVLMELSETERVIIEALRMRRTKEDRR